MHEVDTAADDTAAHRRPRNAGIVAPESVRARLRARIEREGQRAVQESTGLSRDTIARLLAGLGVRRGTILQAEER